MLEVQASRPIRLPASQTQQHHDIENKHQVLSFSGAFDLPKAPEYANLPRGIHTDVENIVRQNPTRIAAELGTDGVKLTYEMLNNLACQVAEQLLLSGIEPEELVPIVASRTPYTVVAMMGVLKAGGAYVPCDAEEWTRERLDSVLAIIKPKNIVVSDPAFVSLISCYASVNVIETPKSPAPTTKYLPSRPMSNDLAYVIMTSGSTGIPKGVMVEHRNLIQYVRRFEHDRPANMNVHLGDRVFVVYSIAFDAFSGVVWSCICNGGTLCLADKSNIVSVAKTVSVLPATPSILSSLTPSELPNIRSIFLGGEALPHSLVESWAAPNRRIFNCYGPTETTCVSTMTEITSESDKATIGRPLAGSAVLVLDNSMTPVDIGVSGEIVIGGAGVARGYLGNTKLTEEKFVEIDWINRLCGGRSLGRWYRTGDYAKWTADGMLEYLGRADWRVKNRGFLIDLEGDVESAMVADRAVSDARAFMIHGRLVGVVTPGSVNTRVLRDRLSQCVPSYMICNQIWALDTFPRTSNDKVDRKSLQRSIELLMDQDVAANGPEPSTAAEHIIANGFKMLFGVSGAIGIKAAFIEMGGDSLMAIRLVTFAKAAGLQVTFQDVLQCNTIDAIAAAGMLVTTPDKYSSGETLSVEDRELLGTVIGPNFEAVAENIAPLTPSQRGMFMESMSKQSVYVLQIRMLLHDKTDLFDVERFFAAWECIVQRHAIFRSSFHLDHNVQVVHKHIPLIPRNIHFFATEGEVNDAVEAYLPKDFQAGFTQDDLSFPGHMMRIAIFAVSKSKNASFVWTIHHGLIDGVSATILQEELISLYENSAVPSDSAVIPRSFASVAREIVSYQSARNQAIANFWQQHLKEASTAAPPNLPMMANTSSSTGSEIVFDSDLQLDQVAGFAQTCGVTLTTVFLAAATIVLTQYTDKPDTVLGVVYTGRSAVAHSDEVVGPVVNTLPVFVSLKDEMLSVKDFLRALSNKILSVASWEWSSLGSVMAAASIPCNASLFDFAFSFADDFASLPKSQAATTDSRLQLLDITQRELTQFPFTITFERNTINRRTVSVRIRQQPQRIHQDLASNLGGHLCNAVVSLMTQSLVKDVQITDEAERLFLAKELNSHHKEPYRATMTVSERLNRSLKTHRDLPAIVQGDLSISYTELDRKSDAVAYYLAARLGVKVGSTVGILAMHHTDWLVGACGIVKAGAAYLPIDASYPPERQAWILKQGDNTGVLLAPHAPTHELFDVEVLLIDDVVKSYTSAVQLPKPSVQDIVAYLYTSGSTGVPKGVPLTQGGLDISLQPDYGHLWAAPGRRTALMVALGFDCAFLSTFGSLMYGGCVVLQQPDDLLEHLKQVHCLMCTPSMLASLNEAEYKHLDSVALAGEALPQGLADTWSPGRRLINMYGPSECHVFATYKFLPQGEPVSLGRPLPTGRIYVVNPHSRSLVPVGLTGEIWIGGSSPTIGYVGLGDATAEKFLVDPFGHTGEFVYRTGDVGRWNLKGELEYVGRMDDLIKIKGGFRLSLIGVENALNREATQFLGTRLNSATVVVVKDRLVAYVTPGTINVVALRERLLDTEPHFAVPKWIIAVDSVPITQNQKVDKKALIARGFPQTEEYFEAPRTPTERRLASLWKELLEMPENVSATAHFVRLGGTSLNHIRLVSALQRHYQIKVPLTLALRNPILRNQATALDELLIKEGKQPVDDIALEDLDIGLLSHSERSMWLVSQLAPIKTPFTVSVFYTIRGHVDIDHLKKAFDIILRRHSIFRARYLSNDAGQLRRMLHEDSPQALIITAAEFHRSLEQSVNHLFDLASEHLVRLFLAFDEEKTDVLFTAHHIVVDHWTIDILMREVSDVYAVLCNDKPVELPTIYLDYPQWAAAASCRPPKADSINFWMEYLRDIPDCIGLPSSSRRRLVETHGGKSRIFHLPQQLKSAVESGAASMGVTLHQFFSAALLLVLSVFTNQDDVVIGASHVNRTTADEYEMCGLFLDRIPFRVQYRGETSTEDLLRSIAASQQAASLHFDVPFDDIARALQCRRDLGRHPVFQAMLSVENELEALPKLRVPNAVVESNVVAPLGANFDVLMAYQLLPNEGGMRLRFEASDIYEDALVDAIEQAMRESLSLLAQGTYSPAQIRSAIQPFSLTAATDLEKHLIVRDAIEATLRHELTPPGSGPFDYERTFFELGGTSMLVPVLLKELEKRGAHLELLELFMHPSLNAICSNAAFKLNNANSH